MLKGLKVALHTPSKRQVKQRLEKFVQVCQTPAASPLEVVAVELRWDAQDSVVDSGDIGQVPQLSLPIDVGLPEAVGTEVGACSQHRMLVRTDGWSTTPSK